MARERNQQVDKPKAQPVAGLLLTGLAALLIVGVATFAGPCEHLSSQGAEEAASCYWASRALLGIGVVAAVLAIVRVFETDEGERRGLSLGCALLGFLATAVPGPIIALCADPSMHCNAVMRPFVLCVGVAMGLVGAVDLTKRLLSLRKR